MMNRLKSIEDLEGKWNIPLSETSNMINRCMEIRKKPLGELSIEDMRLLIGQDIGLDILVPMAIEVLDKNPVAEGDYFEGDLLKSVLGINTQFWTSHPELFRKLIVIYKRAVKLLDEISTTNEIKHSISNQYSLMTSSVSLDY